MALVFLMCFSNRIMYGYCKNIFLWAGAAKVFKQNRRKYQGNEYIQELGLNWMDFGFRQYDPQLGRFLSVDPLAAGQGHEVYSPYAAMDNNPSMLVDPNGLAPGYKIPFPEVGPYDGMQMSNKGHSPGENEKDDGGASFNSGCASEAIKRQEENTKADEAKERTGDGAKISGNDAVVSNDSEAAIATSDANDPDPQSGNTKQPSDDPEPGGIGPEKKAWDSDGDGRLSLGEANAWRRKSRGQGIEVDASLIDIGYIDTKNLKDGQQLSINFLKKPGVMGTTGIVYGQLDLIYDKKVGGFSILPNMYNFETGADKGFPWTKRYVRNTLTEAGRAYAGPGQDYMIYFKGTVFPSWTFFIDGK